MGKISVLKRIVRILQHNLEIFNEKDHSVGIVTLENTFDELIAPVLLESISL